MQGNYGQQKLNSEPLQPLQWAVRAPWYPPSSRASWALFCSAHCVSAQNGLTTRSWGSFWADTSSPGCSSWASRASPTRRWLFSARTSRPSCYQRLFSVSHSRWPPRDSCIVSAPPPVFSFPWWGSTSLTGSPRSITPFRCPAWMLLRRERAERSSNEPFVCFLFHY